MTQQRRLPLPDTDQPGDKILHLLEVTYPRIDPLRVVAAFQEPPGDEPDPDDIDGQYAQWVARRERELQFRYAFAATPTVMVTAEAGVNPEDAERDIVDSPVVGEVPPPPLLFLRVWGLVWRMEDEFTSVPREATDLWYLEALKEKMRGNWSRWLPKVWGPGPYINRESSSLRRVGLDADIEQVRSVAEIDAAVRWVEYVLCRVLGRRGLAREMKLWFPAAQPDQPRQRK